MIKVAIADDHMIFRQGLKQLIEECGSKIKVVGEAGNKQEIWNVLRVVKPCILLLDISMPGASGLELLELIKSDFPKVFCLILSMHAEDQFALRALRSGAKGYLAKDCAAEDLINAIETVARGELFIGTRVANLLASEIIKPQSGP